MNRNPANGRFEAVNEEINNERAGADVESLLSEFDTNMKRFVGKIVLSFVYGWCWGAAAGLAIDAIAMLTMPFLVKLIVDIAVVIAVVYVSAITADAVSSAAYDGLAFVGHSVKRLFTRTKERVASFPMPKFMH